jgi:hypothetical protein
MASICPADPLVIVCNCPWRKPGCSSLKAGLNRRDDDPQI